jgi:peptidoglycan/xylan/chitin deacetylase (PgdA/CDA1 family)/SAM-dependent methyltransferase
LYNVRQISTRQTSLMTEPRVSIIIPAYQAETTLPETLQSLLTQTFAAWEAIVVDDGSRDRTSEVAASFAARDERVRIVRQTNGGESAARNAGASLASNDWLVFLDADDWLLPAYLERMTAAISADPDVDVVHCGWLRVARDGQHSPGQFAPPEQDLFPELARRNCFAIHACMVRRSLAASIGPFDVTLKTCPDWDFWQRIARTAPRFASVPEILACYRLRPFSAATHPARLLADGLTVIGRGHTSDPRVHSPDPRYARGMPAAQAAEAKLRFVCWAAGLAIGQGQPAESLLDAIARERGVVPIELAAESLFTTVPMPTGQFSEAWATLWPTAEPLVDSFLAALEAHSESPGLAAQIKLLLVRKIMMWAESAVLSQRALITELQTAVAWHDDQRQVWHRRAESAELHSTELQTWIRELETGIAWHDDQRQRWQRRAEAAEHGSVAARGPGARVDPFAEPRMLHPVSREWGYDRGRPVDRYYIERFLAAHEQDVKGRVLEIGDNSYTRRFGADRVTTSDVLNVVPGNEQATIVGDLTQADHIPTGVFDCVILTQTLQLVYDLPAALRTVHRILQPGGVLLATFPGLTRTSQTEWKGSWFWRLTPASARRLFEAVFPPANLELTGHGNVLAASAFLYGLAVEDLTAEELDHEDADFDVIVTVRAVKEAAAITASDRDVKLQLGKAVTTPSATATALVLLYHRVGDCTLDPWQLSVSPDRFDEQMSVLKRQASVVSLRDLRQQVNQSPTDRPLVAISFDDGYADNLYNALPALEKYGLPATVFVCTGPVADQHEFWWDTLERLLLWPSTLPSRLDLVIGGVTCQWDLGSSAEYSDSASREYSGWRAWEPPPTPRHELYVTLWRRLHELDPGDRARAVIDLQGWAGEAANSQPRHRPLGPAELRTLAQSRHIEIGAHTINHPALATLPARQQQTEIEGSRTWLETLLGHAVTSFSYPFGKSVDYTAETVSLVREAGFDSGCSNIAGTVRPGSDPFQLPRVQVSDCDGEELERQIRQWLVNSVC